MKSSSSKRLWLARVVAAPIVFLTWLLTLIIGNLDPHERRNELWSHVQRFGNRYGWRPFAFAAALSLVAFLPAAAVPVYFTKGKTVVTVFSKLGPLQLSPLLVGATSNAKQQLLPFRYGTVLRRVNIGKFSWSFGSAIPTIVVPQVGMFAKVFVDVEGAYTVATAPLVIATLDGFDAIMQRARVTLNNGSASIVDCSGIGVNIINRNESFALPIKRGLGLALGAQTFTYKYQLPINANNQRQFEMGLVNLQAPELRANIDLIFANLANVFTVPANFTAPTLTANVSYQYWEIPDPTLYALPPLTVVRSIEEAPIAVATTGDQIYQVPRLGTMFEYHGVLVFNNLYVNLTGATPAATEFRWRYNKTDTPFDVFIGDWETIEALVFGYEEATTTFLSNSAITLPLWAADNRPRNGGDFRDAIDTEENTTTESIITINSAQTLTPGKDNIFHVRRVVQRIIQAPTPSNAAA